MGVDEVTDRRTYSLVRPHKQYIVKLVDPEGMIGKACESAVGRFFSTLAEFPISDKDPDREGGDTGGYGDNFRTVRRLVSMLGKTGCQPVGNLLCTAEQGRKVEKTGEKSADSESDQRHGHYGGWFVGMLISMGITRTAVEDDKDHPERIVGGHTGYQDTNQPDPRMPGSQG